jgi:hypothetical protein
MNEEERAEEELLDILAPKEGLVDEDGYLQGCADCGWNPDMCDCGMYDFDEEE